MSSVKVQGWCTTVQSDTKQCDAHQIQTKCCIVTVAVSLGMPLLLYVDRNCNRCHYKWHNEDTIVVCIRCYLYAPTLRVRGDIYLDLPLSIFLNHIFHLVFFLQNWLYACELNHFVQFIVKGKTRIVEAFYCPQSAVLFETELWKQLRSRLHYSKVTG